MCFKKMPRMGLNQFVKSFTSARKLIEQLGGGQGGWGGTDYKNGLMDV